MIDQVWQFLADLYKENQFFQGAGVIALVSAVLTGIWMYMRQIPQMIWSTLIYYASISVELQDHAPSFEWLARYTVDEFKKRNSGPFFSY